MRRIFVGLGVNPDLQTDLHAVCRKLKIAASKKELSLRFVPAENWHVTIQFLGDSDETTISAVCDRLDTAANSSQSCDIRCSGIGAFPDEHHARVLYAGIAKSQRLLDLQSKVEAEMASLGFPAEGREFRPHLTLARLRSAVSVKDLISPFVRKSFLPITVTGLTLFESVQRGPHMVYLPIHKSRLNGAAAD